MRPETEVMKPTNNSGTRTTRMKALTFDDFIPDLEMSENKRGAQFLDWCARNMPGRFIPYVWLTKVAYLKHKIPRLDNDDVNTTRRKRISSIKQILWTEYHRRTVASPRDQDPGMRATTDSDDLAGTDYLRRTRRVASGARAAAETREKIDTASMHDKSLKAMVERTDPIMKQLVKADLMKRLELPPRRDEDD